ncbi:MAG: 3-oxoacyl-ACP synthase III [Thermoguttaceae bacterium]|nr:3-oxoacyl-ACP synthase III [Thermoguttaceae bacterium]
MKYERVYIEAIECTLPEEIVTSEELELQLAPLYERLKLHYGRIEHMTGVIERGLWSRGALPGDQSVVTVDKLLRTTRVSRDRIGAFIHASVCRDYQEPATACDVHRRLGLSQNAIIFDVSNACLGLLTGALQIANMIELGQIEAGVVVGTETSRSLMETTVAELNSNQAHTRQSIKDAFASLTIGSGSAAIALVNEKLTRTGNRFLGATVQANTEGAALCRSQVDVTAGGAASGQTMKTDSEQLLHTGVALAARAFEEFKTTFDWTPETIDRLFCHQVGKAHQKLLFDSLNLDASKNFATLPYLGNTGSVALPTAAALGIESGFVKPGDKIGLFGIGSGVNVVLGAVDWQTTLPSSDPIKPEIMRKFTSLLEG